MDAVACIFNEDRAPVTRRFGLKWRAAYFFPICVIFLSLLFNLFFSAAKNSTLHEAIPPSFGRPPPPRGHRRVGPASPLTCIWSSRGRPPRIHFPLSIVFIPSTYFPKLLARISIRPTGVRSSLCQTISPSGGWTRWRLWPRRVSQSRLGGRRNGESVNRTHQRFRFDTPHAIAPPWKWPLRPFILCPFF